MSRQTSVKEHNRLSAGDVARERLLAGIPATERRLQLAGILTAVLEGGDGPPGVFLHGPGAYAAAWMRVIPDLTTTHHVVAPDLPGHGATGVGDVEQEPERVLAWLADLIDQTCASPPALVGHLLGGAIAARFASDHGDQLSRLVLVDSFGLAPFRPAPEFERALMDFIAQPTRETHERLMRRCAFDLDGLRARMGETMELLTVYDLDRARTPAGKAAQHALMGRFGVPAIPPADLAEITVPTHLIWGRYDLATPLRVAEAASVRYGWPLQVIEDAADDPVIEQPEAFLRALGTALGIAGGQGAVA